MSLEPLEVFALTSDMQRATGSIPYTSLMWNRKYYECGDFLMEVPADVYDPSWAYVYTEERPETGIIQKVEYRDTSNGGVDTVILSGFFFEWELNRYTFLVEETEDEAYRIYKPAPAKTVMPTMWSDNLGQVYVKTGGTGGVLARWETIDGDYVDPSTVNQSEMTQIDLQPGDGLTLIEYDTTNTDRFPSGKWNAGEYSNANYSYYSEDGQTLHSVAPNGTETTYAIVSGSGTGDVIYEDSEGNFCWVNGVASNVADTYVRAEDSWENMVKSEGLEVVRGDGTIMGGSTYARAYRTVKGPWQLRTDLDVNEPADNVQRIIQWAQDIWGNNLLYDEVGFTGEEKIIDPSLKLFGDLAYEELKTVEASPRLFYSFESDTAVLQIWRGLDRTQSQAGLPEPEEPVEPEPEEPTIDDLYEAVDYIESNGTQYIDTGFAPNQSTTVVADIQFTASRGSYNYPFGALHDNAHFAPYVNSGSGSLTAAWACLYGILDKVSSSYSTTDRQVLSVGPDGISAGTTTTSLTSQTFQSDYSLHLFGVNDRGSSSRLSFMRGYAFQIYDNETLVRNYVPKRRRSDGIYGLLDLVNEVFYESATEYAFTGPSYAAGTYEELDFIVSTGSQYIDTGIIPTNDTRVTMDARAYGLTDISAYYAFFGARVSGSMYELFKSSKTSWGLKFLWGANTSNLFDIDYSARHQLEINGNTATVDGETLSYTDATFSVGYSLYLGATNNAGSPLGITPMFIYGGSVYEDGVTLSRDYVPRRRVSDGAVGLLDLANDTFYESAGSEAFLAPGELPSGYTQLEYIESTGSQYINTGFAPNQDTRVVMDVQPTSSVSGQTFVFGTRNTASPSATLAYAFAFLSDSQVRSDYFGGTATLDGSFIQRLLIDKNKNTCTVNGEVITNSTKTGQATLPIFLMSLNNTGTAGTYLKGLLYSCQIYDNGTIVRDYVPAKNSSGEAGLFDLTTMAFYADASGTGFVAGPEVAAVAEIAEASTFALARTVAASETTEETANPFAVFSDTWGTLYGFTVSRDVSNYRNTCYVLYQFRDATDADGNPIGPRGYVTARLEDEMPDAETVLDLRGEEPEDDAQTDEAFIESLRQRGLAHLQSNYAIIENLETGTLVQDGYLTGFDLGDKVDMLIEAVGLVNEARITGACEVHEAGSSTVSLEIGEQKITNIRKAVIM